MLSHIMVKIYNNLAFLLEEGGLRKQDGRSTLSPRLEEFLQGGGVANRGDDNPSVTM